MHASDQDRRRSGRSRYTFVQGGNYLMLSSLTFRCFTALVLAASLNKTREDTVCTLCIGDLRCLDSSEKTYSTELVKR